MSRRASDETHFGRRTALPSPPAFTVPGATCSAGRVLLYFRAKSAEMTHLSRLMNEGDGHTAFLAIVRAA